MQNQTQYCVLYTKHITRKHKIYQDGTLTVKGDRTAVLRDEEGKVLATSKLPKSLELEPDSEGIDVFKDSGFLVNCDGLLDGPPTSTVALAQAAPAPAAAPGTGTAAALPGVGSNMRWRPPRPLQQVTAAASGNSLVPQSGATVAPSKQWQPPQPTQRSDFDVLSIFQADPAACIQPPPAPVHNMHCEVSRPGSKVQPDDKRMRASNFASGVPAPAQRANDACRQGQPCSRPVLARRPALATVQQTHAAQLPPVATQAPAGGWASPPHVESEPAAGMAVRPEPHTLRDWGSSGPAQGFSAPRAVPGRQLVASPAAPPQGLAGLQFPGPGEAAPQRRVVVPDTMVDAAQYQSVWTAALLEEVNLRLAELSRQFHAVRLKVSGSTQQPKAPQPGTRNALPSAAPKADMSELQRRLRAANLPYYASVTLQLFRKRPAMRPAGRSKRKQQVDDDDEEQEAGREIVMLTLSGREPSAAYHKHDLWILGTAPELVAGSGAAHGHARSAWLGVAKSCWHGPNQDGRMEVELLTGKPPGLGRTPQAMCALRALAAAQELTMLDNLTALSSSSLPLLPALLSARPYGASPPAADSSSLAQLADTYGLNLEQAAVLEAVTPWCSAATRGQAAGCPIVCLHGPFGAGKTHCLCALVRHMASGLQQSAEAKAADARILVAAHTNIAVDRVLTGLLDAGFTDLLRVGALRRIDKRLLKHSLHCSEAKGNSDAVAELKHMLQAATDPKEAACISRELAALQAGAERQRRVLLRSARVVGVTCCSAGLPALDGLAFRLVVLDEASQMPEPLSLLPLLRAHCR